MRFERTLAAAAIAAVALLSSCGFNSSGSDQTGTVVGTTAKPGQFPWMASTQLGEGAPCGGSLIAPTWVLTGKHCHQTGLAADPERWQVRIGSVDRNDGGELTDAKTFVDYPDDDVDLALIELEKPATVQPLELIPANETKPYQPGAKAITLGWGTDGNSKTAAQYLDWNEQVTAGNDTCKGGQNGVFCAGRPSGQGSATCTFDSGAPYVWADQGFTSNGTPRSTPYVAGTLRGLFNESCGVPGQDDDWQAANAAYGDWIRQQIK